MASDMRPLNSKKVEAPSHGREICGVSDQACHGKCQSCDGDRKPSHAGANSISLKKNCGTCSFNSDHVDALLVDEANGSLAQSGHIDSADCDRDGCLHGKNGRCMACDDPQQESDREQTGNTLDDLFFFNDEEDDDMDWDPSARLVENRWFCFNCTVPNMDEVTHCQNCHALKGSEVVGYDVFQTHIAQATLVSTDTVNFRNLPYVDHEPRSTEGDMVQYKQNDSPRPYPPFEIRGRLVAQPAASSNAVQLALLVYAACVLNDFSTGHAVYAALPPVSTAVGFDERMLLHCEIEIKPNPHPERPNRLRAIAASLAAAGIFPSKCALVPPREITKEELLMVHTSDHVESVEQTKNMLYSYFTSDTYANGHSACAAKLAAGLCADLASLIVSGRVHNGFALVRPPGHHAGVKQAMGFCLHNNAAVAALAAQKAGAKKVLIVDWDVHHGNGTQEIFEGNKSVLYISLHRHEDGNFYPGTGAAHEVGVLDGQGFSVNIPWSCGGVGDNDYIFAFQHVVLPIAAEFAPDITIISAGFDAARGDPLGCCDVTPDGYSQMTSMLTACSEGKLLVILEGGYNLRSISSSATEVVKVLLGEGPSYGTGTAAPSKEGLQTVLQVLEIQQRYWPDLVPIFASLKAQQGAAFSKHVNWGHELKRRKLLGGPGPVWWKWGSKRIVYEALFEGRFPRKIKARGK